MPALDPTQEANQTDTDALLERIQERVLWLSVMIVHHANYIRANRDGTKVGGHQASSASVVTILTSLYFEYMRSGDKISIKPHASPVFHAIQYLLGNLDKRYLTTHRAFHGLQAYPSRTKDPDKVDFSSGSVGLGAVATNFAALVQTYNQTHPHVCRSKSGRFISLVGDAELDEGSVWEAIAEPVMSDLDNVLWIVDLNRQSLDRIIPGIRVRCWREMFAANGWQIVDAKYGRKLTRAFEQPNGELLRNCIDGLSNEAYQRLLRLSAADLREWLPRKSQFPADLKRLIDRWNDDELNELFWNLGGHDFEELRAAYSKVESHTGPSIIFAYTLKGWSLPSVGHPFNHSVLLTAEQIEQLRLKLRISKEGIWDRLDPDGPEGHFLKEVNARLGQTDVQVPRSISVSIPMNWDLSIADCALMQIQVEQGTTMLFISHDLGLVHHVADWIVVMYLGHVVEQGRTEDVFAPPYHPYTEALLSAAPIADTRVRQKRIVLEGEIPSAQSPPPGCPFQTRCPRKAEAESLAGKPVCETTMPPVREFCGRHRIKCHLSDEVLQAMDPVIVVRDGEESEPAQEATSR